MSSRPWRFVTEEDLGCALGVPSMLNREEAQFYFWLAHRMAHVSGSMVDLGCFVGGSTAYLAQGAFAQRKGQRPRMFAYDQFHASPKVKRRQLYAKGISQFDGQDTLPLSKALLSPWSDQVVLRKGRIEDSTWSDGTISLLILDASKTSRTMDMMAQTFFPHLVPGISVIVQQDELHWKEPWIAAQMQRLRACFEPLCYVPGGTVAYLYTRRVAPDLLRARRVHGLSDDRITRALANSAERLSAFGVKNKLQRQINALRLNPGQRKSWRFRNWVPEIAKTPQRIAAE